LVYYNLGYPERACDYYRKLVSTSDSDDDCYFGNSIFQW
jgi:hypothetical protein